MDGSLILTGTLASLAAGSATAVGALPLLFVRRIPDALQDSMLGFAAGVMLAASFFSLILPALEQAQDSHSGAVPALIVIFGLLLGAACLHLMDRYAPHEHFIAGPEGQWSASLRRIWLFVIAITLHNFPEGLAVGVGFGGGEERGRVLAIGIGLQNIPEGLAVTAALLTENYRRTTAVAIGAATGMVEPLGGFLGVSAVSLFEVLLPYALGFAAGAMIYVVSDEIIPETHRKGHERLATLGLMLGFAVMMFLDVSLG